MQAVLYVAHGSRVKQGVEEARTFLQRTSEKVNVAIQEICFLELAEPTIIQGVENCVNRGATKIAVAPILLLTANHLNHDIPQEIAIAQKRFPQVEITIGRAFGVDDRLVASLVERLIATGQPLTDAKVIVVGRGSSDEAVKHDLARVAERLQQQANIDQVDTCFLYGAGTSFEQIINQLGQRQQQQVIFVIPYLLFSGLLKTSIEKKIAAVQANNNAIILCECLGYDDNVQAVLIDRVNEAIV